MTTTTAEDLAAKAKTKQIEADTKARIERAVGSEHPFVPPAQIRAVAEEDYWVVQIDAACFACRLVDDRHVQIARVKSEDHAVLMEMPRRVVIPPVPTPPSPPSPLATVRSLWQQVRDARDPIRSQVNDWGNKVSPHRPDPLADLRVQYVGRSPSPIVGAPDVANADLLRMLGILIAEAASYLHEVPALVIENRRLIETAMAAIRTARESIVVSTTPRRSPLTVGEPRAQVTRSEERILEDAETDVGNLKEILDELGPDIADLTTATPRFLVAALQVLREGWVTIAALRLEGLRQHLQALRQIPSERDATAVLGDLAAGVPEIRWPVNLLEAPTLG